MAQHEQFLVGYTSSQQQDEIHAYLNTNGGSIIAYIPDDTWLVVADPALMLHLQAEFSEALVVRLEMEIGVVQVLIPREL